MGEYYDSRQRLFSDDVTTLFELLGTMFLKLIAENDRANFNFMMLSLQNMSKTAYETFLEINGGEGEVLH